MAQLKVSWTVSAKKQRDRIFTYWNNKNQSTTYSKKLNRKIKERINALKSHPESGKQTEFKHTRATALGHFSIYYKIIK